MKIHVTADDREVVFFQDPESRLLRVEPEVPRYRENPRYLTRMTQNNEVARWAQVGDVVFFGELCFGEVVSETSHGSAGMPMLEIESRAGAVLHKQADEVRVVHHNIQGLGKHRVRVLDSGCLLGLRTTEELEHACRVTMEETRNWLLQRAFDDAVDLDFVYEIHRRIFGRIFSWAGSNRTTELFVGRKDWRTTPPQFIKPMMDQFGDFLRNEVTQELAAVEGLHDTRLWRTLAEVYFRLCKIHPFRDGNGRLSRLLVEFLLAKTIDEASAYVDWSKIRRFGNQTDRAFEVAREWGDLRFLATLIFRAHCKFVGPSHVTCPTGLRADLVGRS